MRFLRPLLISQSHVSDDNNYFSILCNPQSFGAPLRRISIVAVVNGGEWRGNKLFIQQKQLNSILPHIILLSSSNNSILSLVSMEIELDNGQEGKQEDTAIGTREIWWANKAIPMFFVAAAAFCPWSACGLRTCMELNRNANIVRKNLPKFC